MSETNRVQPKGGVDMSHELMPELKRRGFLAGCGLAIAVVALLSMTAPAADGAGGDGEKGKVDLGQRWELLVDDWLIDDCQDVSLRLNEPQKAEVALVTDASWEGPTSAYFSVVQDGDLVRLYYRGSASGSDLSENQVTCMAESRDGAHFTRPKLGIVEIEGSADNNVVWKGIESHNIAVFLDKNPACKPQERYKALGGIRAAGKNWLGENVQQGLYAFGSPDGIHWKKIAPSR